MLRLIALSLIISTLVYHESVTWSHIDLTLEIINHTPMIIFNRNYHFSQQYSAYSFTKYQIIIKIIKTIQRNFCFIVELLSNSSQASDYFVDNRVCFGKDQLPIVELLSSMFFKRHYSLFKIPDDNSSAKNFWKY